MEVQVLSPSPATDFNLESTSTTPYATAPSSPQSTIPFTWEEKPGIPKQHVQHHSQEFQPSESEFDFAFGFLERHSISAADELFDCGKIKPLKPLKPPPRMHGSNDSPKSPKSPKQRFKEALSPRKKEFDPFSEALKQTSSEQKQIDATYQHERGRTTKNARHKHKVTRSLSPFKIGDIVNNNIRSGFKDQVSTSTWYNKWNIKSLLLFRSVSEGSGVTRKKDESFSYRSMDDGGSTMEDEMRKKANSSYKSGLMGCLRFNQNAGSVHEISRGINSVMKR